MISDRIWHSELSKVQHSTQHESNESVDMKCLDGLQFPLKMVQVQTTVIIILYFVIHCPLLHSPMVYLNINYMHFSINWTSNSALFEAFPDCSHTKTRIECVFKYSPAVFIYISTDVLWQSKFNLIQYNLQSPLIHIIHFTFDRAIVVCRYN